MDRWWIVWSAEDGNMLEEGMFILMSSPEDAVETWAAVQEVGDVELLMGVVAIEPHKFPGLGLQHHTGSVNEFDDFGEDPLNVPWVEPLYSFRLTGEPIEDYIYTAKRIP